MPSGLIRRLPRALLHSWRALLWKLARSRRDSVTIPTVHGLMTVSTRDQFISKALYVRRQYGQDVMRLALKLIRTHQKPSAARPAYLIDIGANVGTVCIQLLREGAFERALAFEPDPVNFTYLQRNIEQNDLAPRLRAFDLALSSAPGEMVLERSGDNYGDHRLRTGSQPSENRFHEESRELTRVRLETLDHVLTAEAIDPAEIGLVWMDTQGHETHVLKGSQELLAHGPPVVTEFWPYGLRRSGVSEAEFVAVVQRSFTHFYDLRDPRRAPVAVGSVSDLFRTYPDAKFTDLLLLRLDV
jgi:FkbM family methyltransferase